MLFLHGSHAPHAWLAGMRFTHGSYVLRAWLLFAARRRAAGARERGSAGAHALDRQDRGDDDDDDDDDGL